MKWMGKFSIVGLLMALAIIGHGETEESLSLEELLATLPPELEAKRVDPITIEKNLSYLEGERMHFKLGWSIFTVASSIMEVSPITHEGEDAVEISMQTRTNSFADKIYRVRNHSRSIIAADGSRSPQYDAQQEEGSRSRNTSVFFDAEAGTARYVNHKNGENRAPIDVMPGTFDPLGIVFFVRSLDIAVGDELVIPTTNGKEFFFTIVRVTKKVKRKFGLRQKREAFVLEPDIKDLGGVFKKSPDGKIKIFLSADDEKLPLRMESEVAVGSFWAELSEEE